MRPTTGCSEYQALSRRSFLQSSAVVAVATLGPAWLPRVAFAQSGFSRDIVVSVYLRGGCDGLTMCVPHGSADYYTARPNLAIPQPDSGLANKAIDLDGYFGLPPALAALKPVYDAGQFAVVHATGSKLGTRSHFDAQRYMEVAEPTNPNTGTGWLGRHLSTIDPMIPDAVLRGLVFNYGLSVTMAGGPKSLPIPDPADFGLTGVLSSGADRRAVLDTRYDVDALLKTVANDTQATMDLLEAIPFTSYVPGGGAVYPEDNFSQSLKAGAAIIRAEVGVEAMHLDYGGWDTHANQDPFDGTMYNLMKALGDGLAAFHTDLFAAGYMDRVTVVVLSEFGRVVKENGSAGTDHGHGNVAMLMGGNVVGNRVHGIWPGLEPENLYQGQDLEVTIDYRDILAEVVAKRLGNTNLAQVFPNYTPTFRGFVV